MNISEILTIFTTVGFGDMSAYTTGETLYADWAMIVGTVVNSIIMSEAHWPPKWLSTHEICRNLGTPLKQAKGNQGKHDEPGMKTLLISMRSRERCRLKRRR